MASEQRGPALTTFAILFGVLAVSNLLKPLQMGGPEHTGFVFFGQRTTGTANAILGPLFGIYLLVYAVGVWRLRRFALPMAYAYAAYVIVNLIAFTVLQHRLLAGGHRRVERRRPAPHPAEGRPRLTETGR